MVDSGVEAEGAEGGGHVLGEPADLLAAGEGNVALGDGLAGGAVDVGEEGGVRVGTAVRGLPAENLVTDKLVVG